MKSNVHTPPEESSMSPPTRGAWIEMLVDGKESNPKRVAPHTGGVD